MRRMLIISDTHCGSKAGLTPPGHRSSKLSSRNRERSFAEQQTIMWDWFDEEVGKLGKIDVLVVAGDMIDGPDTKTLGSQQITTDSIEQAYMACDIVKRINADKVEMLYGTNYHTGYSTDFEEIISREVGAEKIEAEGDYGFEGVNFNVRHYAPGSSTPYGKGTPLSKERVWQELKSQRYGVPSCDVLIRAHNHYYVAIEEYSGLCISLPCLQGYGTKYGSRVCSRDINIGFVHFDCENGDYKWKPTLLNMELIAPQRKQL